MNERPCVSVIVPTSNEEGNIGALLVRLQRNFLDLDHEIIIADAGSADATLEEARRVMPDVRVLNDQDGGLTAATKAAMAIARGKHIIVMDGDLQHDPATARRLLDTAEETGADLVNASRYVPGGLDRAHGPIGRAVTSLPRFLAWSTLPKVRALGITDPHSRFFLVRNGLTGSVRADLDGALLISILHEAPIRRTVEIGYIHNPRGHGKAKAGLRTSWNDLKQAATLANASSENRRAATFALVGMNGFVITLLALAVMAGMFGMHPVLAAVVALEVAIISNFIGHEKITYANVRPAETMGQRAAAYYVEAHNPATLNIALFTMLHVVGGVHWLWAEFFALYGAAALSYGADVLLSYPFASRMRAAVNKAARLHAQTIGDRRNAELEAITRGEPALAAIPVDHARPAIPFVNSSHQVLPVEAWEPSTERPIALVELMGSTTGEAPRDLDPGYVRIRWSADNPAAERDARAKAEAQVADLLKP